MCILVKKLINLNSKVYNWPYIVLQWYLSLRAQIMKSYFSSKLSCKCSYITYNMDVLREILVYILCCHERIIVFIELLF